MSIMSDTYNIVVYLLQACKGDHIQGSTRGGGGTEEMPLT